MQCRHRDQTGDQCTNTANQRSNGDFFPFCEAHDSERRAEWRFCWGTGNNCSVWVKKDFDCPSHGGEEKNLFMGGGPLYKKKLPARCIHLLSTDGKRCSKPTYVSEDGISFPYCEGHEAFYAFHWAYCEEEDCYQWILDSASYCNLHKKQVDNVTYMEGSHEAFEKMYLEKFGRCCVTECKEPKQSWEGGNTFLIKGLGPFCQEHEKKRFNLWSFCNENDCTNWVKDNEENLICSFHGGHASNDFDPGSIKLEEILYETRDFNLFCIFCFACGAPNYATIQNLSGAKLAIICTCNITYKVSYHIFDPKHKKYALKIEEEHVRSYGATDEP